VTPVRASMPEAAHVDGELVRFTHVNTIQVVPWALYMLVTRGRRGGAKTGQLIPGLIETADRIGQGVLSVLSIYLGALIFTHGHVGVVELDWYGHVVFGAHGAGMLLEGLARVLFRWWPWPAHDPDPMTMPAALMLPDVLFNYQPIFLRDTRGVVTGTLLLAIVGLVMGGSGIALYALMGAMDQPQPTHEVEFTYLWIAITGMSLLRACALAATLDAVRVHPWVRKGGQLSRRERWTVALLCLRVTVLMCAVLPLSVSWLYYVRVT